MFDSVGEFAQRHWLALIRAAFSAAKRSLAIPVAIPAAWVASLVVPEIVKAVVHTVVQAVTGN